MVEREEDSDMARMTLDAFTAAVAAALGPRLVTLLLYGSAAREQGAGSGEPPAMNTLMIADRVDTDLFASRHRCAIGSPQNTRRRSS